MINDALDFLLSQLNEYLRMKTGEVNVVKLQRLVTSQGADYTEANKVIFQLVNIDEERVGKAQLPIAPPVGSNFPIRNPELKLNLSVMFTAIGDTTAPEDATPEYLMSIRLLSFVIRFFQYKHVFTRENSPSMPSTIDTLIVELYPVTLENQNYLWSSLGVKYRPSAVYKVRLISVFEDAFSDFVGTPTQIDHQLGNT